MTGRAMKGLLRVRRPKWRNGEERLDDLVKQKEVMKAWEAITFSFI